MTDLMRTRLGVALIPSGLFGLLGGALLLVAGVASPGAVALVAGAPALAVTLYAALRARAAERDLLQLAEHLQADTLLDVGSLRPQTEEGRGVADALSTLMGRVRQAAESEDAARSDIEIAQALRVNFVASMGHDLRAPLNNMLGFADLLLMDDADPQAAAQRASVERIRQRTLDLLTLIDEILDWARLEAGRLKLQPEPVALSTLIAGAVELAKERAAGRPFAVQVGAVPEGVSVVVDRAHLEQALVAVMGDAIRDTTGAPAPVTITARVSASETGQRVEIIVRDPSLLVRDEDQARFFEAFRPSYAPSGKRIAGLGLGVACARALLRAHGGDVRFTSHAGSGTEFVFRLED